MLKYKNFATLFTAHDAARIAATFTDLERSGLLTTQPVRELQWIGILSVRQMVESIMHDTVDNGVMSWDLVVSKCLTLVMMTSFGARARNLALSAGHDSDQYCQWQHIRVKVKSGFPPTLDNVQTTTTLAFEK